MPETRYLKDKAKAYKHEMTPDDHEVLAKGLKSLVGMVVVSGYRCDLYDALFAGWRRVDRHAFADGAKARIESLWMSPGCEPDQMEIAA